RGERARCGDAHEHRSDHDRLGNPLHHSSSLPEPVAATIHDGPRDYGVNAARAAYFHRLAGRARNLTRERDDDGFTGSPPALVPAAGAYDAVRRTISLRFLRSDLTPARD